MREQAQMPMMSAKNAAFRLHTIFSRRQEPPSRRAAWAFRRKCPIISGRYFLRHYFYRASARAIYFFRHMPIDGRIARLYPASRVGFHAAIFQWRAKGRIFERFTLDAATLARASESARMLRAGPSFIYNDATFLTIAISSSLKLRRALLGRISRGLHDDTFGQPQDALL